MTAVDVVKASLYLTYSWYKNNRVMLAMSLLWPYLMAFLVLALGSMYGSLSEFTRRMGVSNPVLYMLASSTVAFSSIAILEAAVGFVMYNRWLGTLQYIVLSPVKSKTLIAVAGIPDSMISAVVSVTAVAPAAAYFEGLHGALKAIAVLLLILAGMTPMLAFSVIAAAATLSVREETNVLAFLNPLILLLSGVFYPIEVLPRLLQLASKAVPSKYVIDAAKLVATYTTPEGKLLMLALYPLAALAVAYNLIALAGVDKAVSLAKRRGFE
ncbi:MAG: hypothetical protein DRN96_04800 [Thermoproteota archaeon]|nr:MAG: hypothetical protein DRN96_04800 [Candidatus Korarchaeota archaeon]